MNKRTLIGVVVLGATALTGCSNKSDANEKNFGAAITQYFDQKGAQCLGLSSWPVDVTEYNASKGLHDAPAMAALESAGLVHSVDAEVLKPDPFGTRRVRVKRYTLTEQAKPFVREWEARTIPLDGGPSTVKEADLCWGRKTLEKVIKWEGPVQEEKQVATVVYTYKVEQVAPWANDPKIQAVYGSIERVMADAGKRTDRHGLRLTNLGWQAAGLD